MPKENYQPKKNILKSQKAESTPKKGKIQSKEAKKPFAFTKNEKFRQITGLFLILFSVYLLIAFVSYLFTWKTDDNIFYKPTGEILFDKAIVAKNWMGKFGAVLSHLAIKQWFGMGSFMILLLMFISGVKLLTRISLLHIGKTFRYSFFGIILISVILGDIFQGEDYLILGGSFGFQANLWLESTFGKFGTVIVILFSLITFIIIAYNLKLNWKRSFQKEEEDSQQQKTQSEISLQNQFLPDIEERGDEISELYTNNPDETQPANVIDLETSPDGPSEPDKNSSIEFTVANAMENPEGLVDEENAGEVPGTRKTIDTPYDPKEDLPHYQLPSMDLLDEYSTESAGVQKEELEANKNRIIETLNNYAIQIEKIKATIGPTVTLYEIVPAPGIRISKIKNLEDDIALSLSALGIRIIAPIPGKGTIGIEVPNQKPEIVSMKSIFSSEKWQNNIFELPIGLGKTISNETFITDLTKMPHLLLAGATGQGKSVGLNCIIASLLYKKHPSQLKFVMVDPKKVELTLFSKIERHYLAKLPDAEEAIITDTREVVRTLHSLCMEMESRYNLLKDAQVRNIKEYNIKFIERKLNPNDGHQFLPYIVLVVDEFADLIMTAGKEIETPITRLAQLARAVGIHLIIATQRPSVNIITGTIKANFPARIAFKVTSKIDSRTILDANGADQLIGRGDMLLSTGNDLIRLQCAFVDLHEVERITEFVGSQRGYPDAMYLPECPDEDSDGIGSIDPDERDELFEDAARIIVQTQQGSTSLLQRKLKLGYNRAGRIIDQLEAAGIVGPFEGSKAREVKIKDEFSLEQYLRDNQ